MRRNSPRATVPTKGARLALALLAAGWLLPMLANAPQAAALRFQIGDWVTECRAAGCSITGLFQQTNLDGRRGSFALVIMMPSRQLAVVGDPFPVRARLQINKNNPAECVGVRYCIFSSRAARRLIDEMGIESLVLADVYTVRGVFHSSLSTIAYQATLAKLQAEGYAVPAS
jgi:hypothetical protein